jgi:hypothetical protein
VPKGAEILRYEIAESAWQGPPENALGWWRSTVAERTLGKIIPTPVDELLDHLGQLCEAPEQIELANLLAIHLLRRRILQLADTVESLDEQPTHIEYLHSATNQRFSLRITEPDSKNLASLQTALHSILYREG